MRCLFVFCVLLPFCSPAQNLLVNGSFEDENWCTEYNIACAPEGWLYTMPSFIYYFKEPALAHSGSKFAGLIAGHAKKPFYRTYMRSRLLCGLRSGHHYTLEFYIKSRHTFLENVGVLFTAYDFLFQTTSYSQLMPSLYLANAVKKLVANDTAWQKVMLNYTAKGDEAFVTIGYFGREDITGPTGIDMEANFFFFIDDVSLTPSDPFEKRCADWQATRTEIYEQNERHEYLQKLILYKKREPLQPVQNTVTNFSKIDTLLLPDVWFATGSSALKNNNLQLLDSLCHFVKNKAIDSLVVEGHTDSTGNDALNETLGKNRAETVAAYMRKCGVAFAIITRSLGRSKPISTNTSTEGRQRNRRVELYLYARE